MQNIKKIIQTEDQRNSLRVQKALRARKLGAVSEQRIGEQRILNKELVLSAVKIVRFVIFGLYFILGQTKFIF